MLQVNVAGTERKVTSPVHAFDYVAVSPELANKAKATVLVERHGLERAQSFARSLLPIPAHELRNMLLHLVESDVAQHVDGGAP
jgi:hypothetical protein